MKLHSALFIAIAVLAFSGTTRAQWVNYPTAAIPRLPDGKPNLAAPTPRTAANGSTRIVLAGLNQIVLTDGSVVKLTVRIGNNSPQGSVPLHVVNAVASDASGKSVAIKVYSGRVVITGAK